MANTTDVAAGAAVPSSDDIDRASAFAREPFLLDGEGPEALAPGTARRQALDAALSELAAGAEHPSIEWRRNYSMLLGLERFLAVEPPTLRDGAELSPHQVDALSGTLAELMAQQQVGSAEAAVELGAGEVGADEPDDRRKSRSPTTSTTKTTRKTRRPRTRSRRTGRNPAPRTKTRSSRRPPTIPARRAASGSSTRPAPARPSPRSASSRRPAPAAS